MFPPPTKIQRFGWFVFYGIFAAGGVVVLTFPPRTIEGPLGGFLTVMWGMFWVTAIVPAIAALYNRFKIEYPMIILVFAGAVIYAVNIWAQVSETPTRATQALAVSGLSVGLILRWLDRRHLVRRDKERNAREDLEG